MLPSVTLFLKIMPFKR